jgi:hypothetical protein
MARRKCSGEHTLVEVGPRVLDSQLRESRDMVLQAVGKG